MKIKKDITTQRMLVIEKDIAAHRMLKIKKDITTQTMCNFKINNPLHAMMLYVTGILSKILTCDPGL